MKTTANNLLALAATATTTMALADSPETAPHVAIPVHIPYATQAKVLTKIRLPYPPYDEISAVYDQGSPDFFIFESNSTMNWGCRYLSCQGHCNVTVPEAISYNLAESQGTRTDEKPWDGFYGYGGGLYKSYTSDKTINDTLTFVSPEGSGGGGAGETTELGNTQVALVQYLQQREYDADGKCQPVPTYSNAILGISPFVQVPAGTVGVFNTTGPSFRQNLKDAGKVGKAVQSLWFEKAPEYVREEGQEVGAAAGVFTGIGLLGGVDTSKYEGKLVRIPWTTEPYTSLSYLTYAPNITVVSGDKRQEIENSYDENRGVDMGLCIIDSGTFSESFNPANITEFLNATGLVVNQNKLTNGVIAGQDLSWPGKCATVPEDVFIEYEFTGTEVVDGEKEKVQIKIPLRNYQHYVDPLDEEMGWCTVSMNFYGCAMGNTFASGAFWAADDEKMVMAVAQGGIAERGSGVDVASVVAEIP